MASLSPVILPSDRPHGACPGVWYRTDRTRNGEPLVGALIPSAHKSAWFDMLAAAGLIPEPQDQEKEKFMLLAPGRPLFLPASAVERIRRRFGINPGQNGALYRNELEAWRAFTELARQRIRRGATAEAGHTAGHMEKPRAQDAQAAAESCGSPADRQRPAS